MGLLDTLTDVTGNADQHPLMQMRQHDYVAYPGSCTVYNGQTTRENVAQTSTTEWASHTIAASTQTACTAECNKLPECSGFEWDSGTSTCTRFTVPVVGGITPCVAVDTGGTLPGGQVVPVEQCTIFSTGSNCQTLPGLTDICGANCNVCSRRLSESTSCHVQPGARGLRPTDRLGARAQPVEGHGLRARRRGAAWDGNLATRLKASTTGALSTQLDFGQDVDMGLVRIYWGDCPAVGFTIDVLEDAYDTSFYATRPVLGDMPGRTYVSGTDHDDTCDQTAYSNDNGAQRAHLRPIASSTATATRCSRTKTWYAHWHARSHSADHGHRGGGRVHEDNLISILDVHVYGTHYKGTGSGFVNFEVTVSDPENLEAMTENYSEDGFFIVGEPMRGGAVDYLASDSDCSAPDNCVLKTANSYNTSPDTFGTRRRCACSPTLRPATAATPAMGLPTMSTRCRLGATKTIRQAALPILRGASYTYNKASGVVERRLVSNALPDERDNGTQTTNPRT